MEFEEIKITSPDGTERIEVRPLGDTEALLEANQKRDHEIAKALAGGAGADKLREITDRGLSEKPVGEIIKFPTKGDDGQVESARR